MAAAIRIGEACEAQPHLLWDTIWVQRLDANGGWGDWILAGPGDQRESRGGLRAEASLHTATLLCLFTDARAADDDALPSGDGDRRGWWGDSVILDGEPAVPLGSKLWLLERAILNETTRQRAHDAAAEALAVLAEQGVVARTEVETAIDHGRGALLIAVRHVSHDGATAYDQRFAVLWTQTLRNAPMNFGDGILVA